MLPALARLELRVRPHTGHVVHAGVGDLRLVQSRFDLRRVHGRKHAQNQLLQIGTVDVAQGVGAKARIGGQGRIAQHHFAKHFPFALVLQAQHHHAAVARCKWAIGVDAGVRRCRARWRRCTFIGVVQRVAHPLAQRFEHGHVDVAALASFAAQQQGRQDVGVGVHAGCDVGHGVARLGRCVGRAGDRQQPGFALDQEVIGLLVAVGAVFAVARNVANNEFGVHSAEGFKRQAHARGRAGCEVLHQHISVFEQLAQHGHGLGVFEVEREALFGAVGPHKVRSLAAHPCVVGPRKVARTGAFDLDDACA